MRGAHVAVAGGLHSNTESAAAREEYGFLTISRRLVGRLSTSLRDQMLRHAHLPRSCRFLTANRKATSDIQASPQGPRT